MELCEAYWWWNFGSRGTGLWYRNGRYLSVGSVNRGSGTWAFRKEWKRAEELSGDPVRGVTVTVYSDSSDKNRSRKE